VTKFNLDFEYSDALGYIYKKHRTFDSHLARRIFADELSKPGVIDDGWRLVSLHFYDTNEEESWSEYVC